MIELDRQNKGVDEMHRYEQKIANENESKIFPEKESGTPGRTRNPHIPGANGIVWITRSGAPWRAMPEC